MIEIKEEKVIILPEKENVKQTFRDLLRGKAGLLTYLALLGLFLGLISVVRIFILGHGETTNTSALVPWGLQITTYVYLVLIGTGCTFGNFFLLFFWPQIYTNP